MLASEKPQILQLITAVDNGSAVRSQMGARLLVHCRHAAKRGVVFMLRAELDTHWVRTWPGPVTAAQRPLLNRFCYPKAIFSPGKDCVSFMRHPIRPGRTVVTPGVALKSLRTGRGWTLAEVARKTGIPVSTLSKVENGKTELTMDRILRISVALEVNIADLFGSPAREPTSRDRGRRSITRLGEGNVVASSYGEYCYHAQDLLEKRAAPLMATIRARSLEEFGEYHRHAGEEFLFVLEGELALHTDTYAPVCLKKGESIYFDSEMGHAYLCASEEPCHILLICVAEDRGVLHMVEGPAAAVEDSTVHPMRVLRKEKKRP